MIIYKDEKGADLRQPNLATTMYRTVEKVPTWAIGYMVNGDPTGLEDDEIKEIDEWMGKNKAWVTATEGEPYFTHYPLFGKDSEVYDCVILCNGELI